MFGGERGSLKAMSEAVYLKNPSQWSTTAAISTDKTKDWFVKFCSVDKLSIQVNTDFYPSDFANIK